MSAAAIELYLEAFRARCSAGGLSGGAVTRAPGIVAMTGDATARAVVTQDGSEAALAELMAAAPRGQITVFDTAPRSLALMQRADGWSADRATAMVHRTLPVAAAATLPAGLELRPVHRRDDDDPEGVGLIDAAAAVIAAGGEDTSTPHELADYLAALPASVRLFAAVDNSGVIRATSGFGRYDHFAIVIFVNTAHEWRGRGLGRTMTAVALQAAVDAGATRASLDSSVLGVSLYRRLGFEVAGAVTRFRREHGARPPFSCARK